MRLHVESQILGAGERACAHAALDGLLAVLLAGLLAGVFAKVMVQLLGSAEPMFAVGPVAVEGLFTWRENKKRVDYFFSQQQARKKNP